MPKFTNVSQTSTPDLIDACGDLRARVADLQAEIDKISGVLKSRIAAGEGADGNLFRAVHVYVAPGTTLDKEKLVDTYGQEFVDKFSKPTSAKNFIKINARLKATDAA